MELKRTKVRENGMTGGAARKLSQIVGISIRERNERSHYQYNKIPSDIRCYPLSTSASDSTHGKHSPFSHRQSEKIKDNFEFLDAWTVNAMK
jgi:hypothetical protein